MQLDQYQRRAMLYNAEEVLYRGDFIAHGPQQNGKYRYLGDVLQQDKVWLLECHGVGHLVANYVQHAIMGIFGLPMGTKLDDRTMLAFSEAKDAVNTGTQPEEAWPKWYTESMPQPVGVTG
ncbi:MAG: hypothetical protein Q7R67_02105 [bacterium]|nr:hypothetical protein [bacterium]